MPPRRRRAHLLLLAAANLPVALYLGRWHGAAPIAALAALRRAAVRCASPTPTPSYPTCSSMHAHTHHHLTHTELSLRPRPSPRTPSSSSGELHWVDLLTRCHQTPAYAQLHACVRLTMLPCPPPTLPAPPAPVQRRAWWYV